MPKIVLPVPETIESVTRPIVLDITRQLEKLTGISPDNTLIYFPGDMEKARQAGTSIGGQDPANIFGANARITIEVDEQYEADRILSTAVYRPENLFVFRDDRIETLIKPAYATTDMTINYRFRSNDKVAAMRWRDEIKTRASMDRGEFSHTVSYHYLIPPEFLYILQEIHTLRETVAPYGEDYPTYFAANTSQRASLITNLVGTQGAWGMAETQRRVLGAFDFEGVPEIGSRDGDDDSWTIGFSYKFRFDKPVACVMMYPLVIHNQLLGPGFRPDRPVDQDEFHLRSYSLSAQALGQFESSRQILAAAALPGVAIPDYDEFLPATIVPSTLRVFTALVTIDQTNPSLLLSLANLGTRWQLDPDILTFLKGEAPYMTQHYRSIFCLNLYQSSQLQPESLLSVDSDLNVSVTTPLDLRQYYHVRLSIVSDLSLVDPAALDRARENGPVLCTLLNAINPAFNADLSWLLYDTYMPRRTLQAAIDNINRADLTDGQMRRFNTVMSFFIQSHPISEIQ